MDDRFEIYLVCVPGLEDMLTAEVAELGFENPVAGPGGVSITGTWRDVWRANLWVRGATRILARIASFRALHLAQLDKRARKVDWSQLIPSRHPVRVEATCRKSRIYHDRAAKQRIERAITETTGAHLADDAALVVKARIEDDLCVLSLDTSGEALHKRGHKSFVGKAPLRETMAALMLRRCGYDGTEPVLDPMCGSGTFILEAADVASGRAPGRDREFAFMQFGNFDRGAWEALRSVNKPANGHGPWIGSDRDSGAVQGATQNAVRAGLGAEFLQRPLSDAAPPDGPPGLVMINPPYGARIGNRKLLFGLYGSLGKVLSDRFQGWRVGLVTSDSGLAKATNLPFLKPDPPIAHGGLKVTLWRTDPL